MKNAIILFLLTINLFSCSESSLCIDVSQSKSSIDFRHYEQDLFNLDRNDLKNSLDKIATKYPVFMDGDYKHPAKINQLNDYLDNELSIKLFRDWK